MVYTVACCYVSAAEDGGEEGGVDIYNPVIINVAAFTEIFITFPRKRVAMKKVE